MKFSPSLQRGYLLRRYKRFLADIETENGDLLTIHCPNTGSMKNCLAPAAPLWYSTSANPKRKYCHTWEIATTPDGHLAGINTARSNALVEEALRAGKLTALSGWRELSREVRYGDNSRVDFCLWGADGAQPVYVEVKNVTLLEAQQGFFPDSISVRATKHLSELTRVVQNGGRAALVFCVQHSGIFSVAPAAHIDPVYSRALRQAMEFGVEMYALKASLSADEIILDDSLPVLFE